MAESQKRTYDFLPLSLMVETQGGVATPVVLRGTPLPATRSETFATAVDAQTSVEVVLYVGESPLTAGNRRLGAFKLSDIPPAPRGATSVKVEFAVDKRCAVKVTASVDGTSLRAEKTFRPPADFDDSSIEQVLAQAEASRTADEEALLAIEAMNRANSLVSEAQMRLAATADSKVNAALAALGLAIASGDNEAIRARSDELETALRPNAGVFGGASDVNDLFGTFFGTAAPPIRSKPAPKHATASKSKEPPGRPVPEPLLDAENLTPEVRGPILGRVFGGGSFTLDTQLCFVLMPFAAKFQPLYEGPIQSSVSKVGLRCERADEIPGVQMITWDIWERINRARVLVAELTDRNANVFYELGVAHALSKDVVLITQSMDFVPFDLKALRCIVYEATPSGMEELRTRLEATLATVMKSG